MFSQSMSSPLPTFIIASYDLRNHKWNYDNYTSSNYDCAREKMRKKGLELLKIKIFKLLCVWEKEKFRNLKYDLDYIWTWNILI